MNNMIMLTNWKFYWFERTFEMDLYAMMDITMNIKEVKTSPTLRISFVLRSSIMCLMDDNIFLVWSILAINQHKNELVGKFTVWFGKKIRGEQNAYLLSLG